MENQLPLCLNNVSYKGLDKYCWKGDLVIVQGTLYFLPTRDLEVERDQVANVTRHFGAIIMGISMLLSSVINDLKNKDKSYLNDNGLRSSANGSEPEFRQKLEEHIAEIKRNNISNNSLPRPVRFSASDIKDIKVKSNKLRFNTSADDYDFKFPRKFSEQVKSALFKAQFSI